MWTDNDTILKDDIVTFMAAFHNYLTLEDFSEPEFTAFGWIFRQIRGRKDTVDWWAVTPGGLFYELSADESELLAAFTKVSPWSYIRGGLSFDATFLKPRVVITAYQA
ncbi:MAG: hypothetical protein NVSMB39_3130 [Candidatus Saccharimonadales bacterium]